MSQTVIGIFENTNEAQEAKAYLLAHGFTSDRIDINTGRGAAYRNTTDGTSGYDDTTNANENHEKESIGDRISNFFRHLFDDDDQVATHTEAAKRGITVTVHTRTEDEASEVVRVLDNYGAVDVDDFAEGSRSTTNLTGNNTTGSTESNTPGSAENYATGSTGNNITDSTENYTNGSAGNTTTNLTGNNTTGSTENYATGLTENNTTGSAGNTTANLTGNTTTGSAENYATGSAENNTTGPTDTGTPDSSGTIPVINEELQVGKKEVETGGVRLRSRIINRPVEESIRLREEHVNVERTPIDRAATEADFANFKEGTIEVKEHTERPVVDKEARVIEEVSLGKEVSEKEEKISDTVRRTEVDTENLGSDKENNL